jgi:glycosyltransferase involved in cell wall biosynthesis
VKDGENGFTYPARDINKLADCLLPLIKNKNLRERMGRNSLKTINNWSYKKAAAGVIGALKFLKNPQVIVAQPGSHHLWRAAVGLQKEGLLKYYATGVYYEPNRFPYFLIKLIPEKLRNKIDQQLRRRLYEGLGGAKVKTFSFYEWLYILNKRLTGSEKISNWLIDRRNKYFSAKVGRLAAREKIKILWLGMDSAREAFLIAKKNGAKCVLDQFVGHQLTFKKILEEEMNLNPQFRGVINKNIKILDQKIRRLNGELALSDKIVTGSEFVKETLLQSGVSEDKIMVIPYGADTNLFHPPKDKNNDGIFRLLFVGNISVRKGCHYLLEAVRQINKPDIKLTMIGEMEDKFFLEKFGNYFAWIPSIPCRQLPPYFQTADVYVYPSLFEGSSLSIYEALASGLPVITTANSGSIVGDGKDGFIIPIRDIKAIKEKILLLYNNKNLRKKMAKNARKQAEKYTWDAYHQKVIEFIKEIL